MSEETVLTAITPEEGGAVPPKVNPVPVAAAGAPTVKLKPVIRKPMIRKPVIGGAKPVTLKPAAGTPPPPAAVPEAAEAAPAPVAADAKKATSSLKAVTGPIPAQAVLRKTGIVAEGLLTPAQAQAAKTKTSRISLESAIGVAPTMKSAAPMKTIRLRRPTDIPPAPGAVKPAPAPIAPAPAPAPVSAPASADAPAPVAEVADLGEVPATAVAAPAENTETSAETKPKLAPVTVTQKKTLKLQRPGFKRPTVSGLRKPGASDATATAPADPAVAPEAADTVADMAPVADITDLKPLAPVADIPAKAEVAGAPAWLNVTTLLAAAAALVVMGLCTWTLYCEAAGPNAGPNDMASFHSDTDRRW